MADPKDHKIISAIVTRLAVINGTGGYNTNVPAASIADSRPNWDENELPAISVIQGPTTSAESPQGRRKTVHEMPVMIKGFLKRGTTAANARKLIADIKKAILGSGSEIDGYLAERWPEVSGTPPGLATQTRETGYSIEYAEGTYEIVGVQVELMVQLMTLRFNAET